MDIKTPQDKGNFLSTRRDLNPQPADSSLVEFQSTQYYWVHYVHLVKKRGQKTSISSIASIVSKLLATAN